VKTLFPYAGGKARQAKWIASFVDIAKHSTYVEPFAGAASVFFAKKPANIEILNDTNKLIYYIFKSLRDYPEQFIEYCSLIEYGKESFDEAGQHLDAEDVEVWKLGAWALFRISAAFSGVPTNVFGWSMKGQNHASTWMNRIKNLSWYVSRLRHATILNQDGIELIKRVDADHVLIYADPPYIGGELWYDSVGFDHERLRDTLVSTKRAKIVLSHYYVEPYVSWYRDWHVVTRESSQSCRGNSEDSDRGNMKVTEAIFLNFDPEGGVLDEPGPQDAGIV